MSALNNIATTNNYTNATTLYAPRSARLRLWVRNAAVYRQVGYGGSGGAVIWEADELFTPPGNYSFDEAGRPFDAVRVRSAATANPAQITLQATP